MLVGSFVAGKTYPDIMNYQQVIFHFKAQWDLASLPIAL